MKMITQHAGFIPGPVNVGVIREDNRVILVDTGLDDQSAKRIIGAAEEAGVQISQLEYVCQFYPSPGGSDEILHLYAASVDSLTVPEFAGLAEEGEDIRLIKWSFSQVAKSVKQAEINVASTWIALQWFIYQSGYFKTES